MEKITIAQDDRLLNYLDGKLTGSALAQLKTELEASSLLKARLEELRIVHRTLALTKLESPSHQFVDNVMRKLQDVPFSHSLSPRNGLLLLAGMIVAAGILMLMASGGAFDQVNGIVSLDQVNPAKKYFQYALPSVSISGKLIINIIVGLNMVLVFILMDRTVLRPFFHRRSGIGL